MMDKFEQKDKEEGYVEEMISIFDKYGQMSDASLKEKQSPLNKKLLTCLEAVFWLWGI